MPGDAQRQVPPLSFYRELLNRILPFWGRERQPGTELSNSTYQLKRTSRRLLVAILKVGVFTDSKWDNLWSTTTFSTTHWIPASVCRKIDSRLFYLSNAYLKQSTGLTTCFFFCLLHASNVCLIFSLVSPLLQALDGTICDPLQKTS